MAKRIKRNKKPGLPPGSVVFTGNRKVEKILLHFLQYDATFIEEKELDNHSNIPFQVSTDEKVNWYDIRGIHDTQLIELIGQSFDIHPLILEDIADTHQRPKFDEYESGVFIVIQALAFDQETRQVAREQVAIFFRKGLIVTFQERAEDLLEPVRHRLKGGKGKMRQKGTDYLAYAILDTIVDNYYIVLDNIEDTIETLEEKIVEGQETDSKGEIHALKKELLTVRKSVAPLREAISRFSKTESPFVDESSVIFIRDLYDHTIQVLEIIETYRDMLTGLQDLFISAVSFKMNQVMQLLTLIATIFIPLTFLAGIYGMNFKYMPELHWKYGYYGLLVVMAIIFFGSMYYFKRKKWI
ncbi:MAG: magnesium/cobalt transporter CorA [Saprospiraceae bacterium]|nr:magnesium/cobalt transporter CorA [Saprospiraceae bacterium]MCB9324645.1 magnesium/cobalt transporter CorA [Lewinellaceae bacterium]